MHQCFWNVLSHWSICLSMCQYRIILIPMAWYLVAWVFQIFFLFPHDCLGLILHYSWPSFDVYWPCVSSPSMSCLFRSSGNELVIFYILISIRSLYIRKYTPYLSNIVISIVFKKCLQFFHFFNVLTSINFSFSF